MGVQVQVRQTQHQVVEQIKQIKPDFIIHTGDLFHRSSPSNRAITFALEKFKEIKDENDFIIKLKSLATSKEWKEVLLS